MKCTKPIYILAANHISIQEPLTDSWIDNPVIYEGSYNEAIDPQFKQWMSPGEARRLGKIMKRAVATSAVVMEQSGVSTPDAIITATGLGCVKNTELFLTDLCNNGEQLLKPTQFMQSTHNTIGSLIAILNKCHGYNVTYANGDTSTENALLDAVTQLTLGDIDNALVGAHDEMTPCYYTLLERIGYYGVEQMVTSGETAVSLMLSTHPGKDTCCVIENISVMYKPTDSQLTRHLTEVGHIDCVMAGFNGKPETDIKYNRLIDRYFNDATVLQYKNIFGESMTASALGIYAATAILSRQKYPETMTVRKGHNNAINSILCLNISGDYIAVVKLNVHSNQSLPYETTR